MEYALYLGLNELPFRSFSVPASYKNVTFHLTPINHRSRGIH